MRSDDNLSLRGTPQQQKKITALRSVYSVHPQDSFRLETPTGYCRFSRRLLAGHLHPFFLFLASCGEECSGARNLGPRDYYVRNEKCVLLLRRSFEALCHAVWTGTTPNESTR